MNTKKYKICPYCNELILTSAKKCRYCQSWLEGSEGTDVAKVAVAEPVKAETVVPPQVNPASRPQVVIVNQGVGGNSGMTKQEADDLYERKKDQEDAMDSLLTEAAVISALFAWLGPYPWWSGIIMFFVFTFLCGIRILRIAFCLIAVGVWAAIGASIGAIWDAEVLGCIIAGVIAFATHLGAMGKKV